MRHLIAVILVLTLKLSTAQSRLDTMISQLRQSNFFKVDEVRDSLVNYGKEAIPRLIVLLHDTSFVKLKNTADLIYPGAEEFYGHGWVVRYDID